MKKCWLHTGAGAERRVKLVFKTVADMLKEADALVFS